ncbi:MAG: hypothetical protein ABWY20_07950 [Mycobacterium sp.]
MILLALSTENARTITLVVIAVALLFGVMILARTQRDKTVRKTRWGFFVERDHYPEEDTYRTNWGQQLPKDQEITKEIKP